MSKKSPREQAIDLAGTSTTSLGEGRFELIDKRKVVEEIAKYLEPRGGESVDDLKARLLRSKNHGSLSNKKLLKLKAVAERMKDEFDGKKSVLIDRILELRKSPTGKIDTDYGKHLARMTLPTLLDRHDQAQRDAKS